MNNLYRKNTIGSKNIRHEKKMINRKDISYQKNPVRKRFFLVWLVSFTLLLSGCGVSSGGNQITKMDEKYLTEQESDSPNSEKKTEEASPDTSQEKEAEASQSDTEKEKEEKQDSQKSSSSKKKENETSASAKSSKANTSKKNTKSSTNKKKNSQTKNSKKKDSSEKKNTTRDKRDSVQKETPASSQKEEETKKDSNTISCYISIDCKTILSNMSQLKNSKKVYVPKDGVILKKTKVSVQPGNSVYDVLYQVCKEKKIHLEAAYTPMYKTYYVEGINQLYEFDCGNLSGWNYLVNGVQPNYGCSKYQVKEGDEIAWRFTCDTGKDL